MKAIYFDGADGEKVRDGADSRPSWPTRPPTARQQMLEALSMYSDELMELLLAEEEVPEALIHSVVRDAVASARTFTPVFLGTAYRNKGVQPLLDAVVRYLPSPLDREVTACDIRRPERTDRACARSRQSRRSAWPSRSSTTRTAS